MKRPPYSSAGFPSWRACVLAVGFYAIAGGGVTLAGWFANIQRLTDWDGNGISMMPNAAVCAICAGAALLLWSMFQARRIVAFLGGFVALIGAATLFEYFSGIDLGIDTLLIYREWGQRGTVVPGRMGPPGSTSWTIMGTALLLATGGVKMRRAAIACALLAMSIASLSLMGYFFRAEPLFTIPKLTTIALQTATIIFALCAGLLVALPEQQPMKTLLADTTAGLLARRALPWIVLLPLLLGWLRVRGQDARYFDTAFGTAMLILVLIGALIALLSWAVGTVGAKERALRREQQRTTQAEQDLRQIQQRVEGIIFSAMDAVISIDSKQRVVMFNPAAEHMFGCPAAEARGSSLDRFIPARFRQGHHQHVQNFGKTGTTSRRMGALGAVSGLRANGEEFPIEASISHLEAGGQKIFTVILRDITERQRAERRLSTAHAVTRILAESSALSGAIPGVLQAIGEGLGWDVGDMWTLDAEANVLRCLNVWHVPSATFEVFKSTSYATTFSPGSSLPGRVWASLKPVYISEVGKDADFVREPQARAVGLRSAFAFPIIAGNKFLGVMEFFSPEFREPDDALLQMFAGIGSQIGQFIQRQRAEEALRQAHALLADRAKQLESLVQQRTGKLQAAIGELEAFSYSVAHDVRAPLRAMTAYADLLLKEPSVSPQGRTYSERISRAAARLDRMTQEVLTYSRLARAEMQLEPIDLDKLAREVVEQYPQLAMPEWKIDIQSPLLSVLGHEGFLVQILANLLINACKFVEPGTTPTVLVRTEVLGENVRLWVEDNGIGIAPEHGQRLFKMFGRIHPDDKYDGTGIGLAIVKKAAERMGGIVGFESEPGKGSRFWVQLKRA